MAEKTGEAMTGPSMSIAELGAWVIGIMAVLTIASWLS